MHVDDARGCTHRYQKVQEQTLPDLQEDELVGVIRLSRRLIGGASISNLKEMCEAMELEPKGNKKHLSIRLELALRAVGFETDAFEPTPEDVTLPLDDFNDKFEEVIYKIEQITETLAKLFADAIAPGGALAVDAADDDASGAAAASAAP